MREHGGESASQRHKAKDKRTHLPVNDVRMLLQVWSTRPLGTQIAAHRGVRASRRRAVKKVRKSGTPTPSTSVLGQEIHAVRLMRGELQLHRATKDRSSQATTSGTSSDMGKRATLNEEKFRAIYPKHKGLKHRIRTVYTWRSPVEPGMEYSPGPTSAVLCTNKSGRLPVPKPTPA